MRNSFQILFILGFLFLISAEYAGAQTRISGQEYASRRAAVLSALDTNSALILKGSAPSKELDYMDFRQDRDLYYVTGSNAPGIKVIFFPKGLLMDGKKKKCFMFYPDFYDDVNNSTALNPQDTILFDKDFRPIFDKVSSGIFLLNFQSEDPEFYYDWLNDKPIFLKKNMMKAFNESRKGMHVSTNSEIIHKLRQIHSQAEIDLIKKAIAVTGDGIKAAMKTAKAGVFEYELQAALEYEMIRQGAEARSFPSIIGSGPNNLILHYDENQRQTRDNELVVMDVGAEFHGYAADVTRTIPVNGHFTKAQADIYQVVLDVQEKLVDMIRPGITFDDIDKKAVQLLKAAGYEKYIRHGVTHPVGLDVHDVQPVKTLEPGMVITIEPGLYIPEDDRFLPKEYHGFGIRIEDDVLVTPAGHENLSGYIPKSIKEIESTMKR